MLKVKFEVNDRFLSFNEVLRPLFFLLEENT